MKKFVLLISVVLLFAIAAVPAFAVKLTVRNESGSTVEELYIASDGKDDWEEDVLEDEVLEAGDSIGIEIDADGEAIGDILAVTENGKQITKYRVNFSRNNIVTIRANAVSVGGSETASKPAKPGKAPSKPSRAPRKPSPSQSA